MKLSENERMCSCHQKIGFPMKLLLTTHSLANPGGMERVLVNKITWLKKHTDWEILVVTTD